MADTACCAPSSLLDHCQKLGEEHNPAQFGSSLPGGIWAGSPSLRHPRSGSRDPDDAGVPIYRVDHEINTEGQIFTPIDQPPLVEERAKSRRSIPDAVPESDDCTASQSLSDFCKGLGEKHDPTQFGTSVPGGCWSNSMDRSHLGKENKDFGEYGAPPPIPIRQDHKMNTDGCLFTPSQSTLHTAMMAGSLESDYCSEMGSWRGTGMSPGFNVFDNQSRNTALLLPAGSPPVLPLPGGRGATSPRGPSTLSDVLYVVPEGPPSPKTPKTSSSPINTPPRSPVLASAEVPEDAMFAFESSPAASSGSGQSGPPPSAALPPVEDRAVQNWDQMRNKYTEKTEACKVKACAIM